MAAEWVAFARYSDFDPYAPSDGARAKRWKLRVRNATNRCIAGKQNLIPLKHKNPLSAQRRETGAKHGPRRSWILVNTAKRYITDSSKARDADSPGIPAKHRPGDVAPAPPNLPDGCTDGCDKAVNGECAKWVVISLSRDSGAKIGY